MHLKSPPGAREPSPPITAPGLRTGLETLLEAHRYAAEFGIDEWQFGLELRALQLVGLHHSEIRWLLCQGYVQQAVETTARRARRRTFRRVANLALDARSCFLLTERGLELVARLPQTESLPASTSAPGAHGLRRPTAEKRTSAPSASVELATPRWLAERQELRLGAYLIKKFRRRAENQTTVLAAFEEEGWPFRIDNPLCPLADLSGAERLHEAIKRLNQRQYHPLLRFHGDGSGEGVTWEIGP